MKGHWNQEGYEGLFGTRGQRLTFGSDWRRGKVWLVSTLRPPSRIGPSIQVFQQASGSPEKAYPDTPLRLRWIQTCIRTIGLLPPQSNLERDCLSASRRALGGGKTYTAHASALPFKDNLLESQIPTREFTLACTSDQFRSSWRSGPNYTPRMQTGPSLQRKVLIPLQATSCKPCFCQNWPWLPQSACTHQPPSSQLLYPGGGI